MDSHAQELSIHFPTFISFSAVEFGSGILISFMLQEVEVAMSLLILDL